MHETRCSQRVRGVTYAGGCAEVEVPRSRLIGLPVLLSTLHDLEASLALHPPGWALLTVPHCLPGTGDEIQRDYRGSNEKGHYILTGEVNNLVVFSLDRQNFGM